MQDVHDQPSIVRQYMRYVGQVHDGLTVQNNVLRALQLWVLSVTLEG